MYFCNLFILSLRSDLHVASHIDMNKLAILLYSKYLEYMSSRAVVAIHFFGVTAYSKEWIRFLKALYLLYFYWYLIKLYMHVNFVNKWLLGSCCLLVSDYEEIKLPCTLYMYLKTTSFHFNKWSIDSFPFVSSGLNRWFKWKFLIKSFYCSQCWPCCKFFTFSTSHELSVLG